MVSPETAAGITWGTGTNPQITAYNMGVNTGYDAANYADAYGQSVADDYPDKASQEIFPNDPTLAEEWASGWRQGWDEYQTELLDSLTEEEECPHGLSLWLCADPINHYPPDGSY